MGNKLGWIIAILLAGALIAFVLVRLLLPSATPPTTDTTKHGALEFVAPSGQIETFLGYIPDTSGNAAEDYAKGIAFFRENEEDFVAGCELIDSEENSMLQAYQLARCEELFKLIAPAGRKKQMRFTFVHTPKELKATAFADGKDDLFWLSNVLDSLCVHQYRCGNIDDAIKSACGQFVLGWHMTNERARAEIVSAGMDIQFQACERLRVCYQKKGDKKKADACQKYLRDMEATAKKFNDKFRIVWANRAEPGDVFNIIENDKDRTWRIEGVLALGVLKFTAKGQTGDMRKLDKHLASALAGNDEMMKAAARVAKECTKQQIQSWAVGN